jgi:hypothetical protein
MAEEFWDKIFDETDLAKEINKYIAIVPDEETNVDE